MILGRNIKNLDERNKWFESLSKKGKRLAIVKDLLESVNANKFSLEHAYFRAVNNRGIFTRDTNLQKILQYNKDTKCTGCYIAGLLYSKIILGNKESIDITRVSNKNSCYLINGNSIKESLNEIFSTKQLVAIEAAFENHSRLSTIYKASKKDMKFIRKAVKFGGKFSRDDIRVEAICNNILENDGKFKPRRGIKKLKAEK